MWDGSQWQPVAAAEPVHAGVFPSWNGIQVEAPDPTAQFAEPAAAPVPVQYQPPPAVDYSYQQADEPGVPLWQQSKGRGKSLYLYPIAALAVLVMAMIVLNSVGYIQLPFVGASSATPSPAPKPSPTPDFSGPDSVRADRFLNKYLGPALTNLDKANTTQNLRCQGHRTTQCFDALTATEVQVKNVLSVIQTQDIPKCIAPAMATVLAYANGMDQQMQAALAAFNDNSDDELINGVYRFRTYYKLMGTGMAAVNQAKANCHTVVLPTWVP